MRACPGRGLSSGMCINPASNRCPMVEAYSFLPPPEQDTELLLLHLKSTCFNLIFKLHSHTVYCQSTAIFSLRYESPSDNYIATNIAAD
ncbi:unnamed protein product [Acanthoscelides obtectus]|uniref:Uncharacterized protein n=1 Tax=Acanthoscelides obtectus TaxID=200917 RepID=A0A9P0NYW1_ACAOB|nr:unnamed protein product [Acanthoscelides obtectus]CAK1671199.1 hypothetical protein AOBTE_LOCUS28136 [Acanthoscelides obtectus]